MDRLTVYWDANWKEWLVFLGNDPLLKDIVIGRGYDVTAALNDFDSKWIRDQGRKLPEETETTKPPVLAEGGPAVTLGLDAKTEIFDD